MNTLKENVLLFDLKRALLNHEAKTGIRLTYTDLAIQMETSVNTIKSIASRKQYKTSIQLISKISNFLKINPTKYMSWEENND